jgi:hypothetical protein
MAQQPIADACKLSATYETVLYPELCTVGVHTAVRAPAQYSQLITCMQDFMTDLVDSLVPVNGVSITIANWGTTGFVGWHQVALFDDTAATYGDNNSLPHQLQAVGTYVNDNELTVAPGRRRNRSYIGPMSDNTLNAAEGRIGPTLQGSMLLAWTNLDGALRGVGSPSTSDFEGLCVVSEAEGVMMDATRVKVGAKYDIHRSRAQKTPENYDVIAIP